MKGLGPILVLACIVGAVFVIALGGHAVKFTLVRVMTCPADAVVPAVEAALVESDFHVIESKTPGSYGVENNLSARSPTGATMTLVLGTLPEARINVQITISGDRQDSLSINMLENRLNNALQRLAATPAPR